jgi:signal peptidase II
MQARLRPFLLSGAILAIDRLTKLVIEKKVEFYDIIPVIPGFFQIVHTQNRGIAFGLFNDGATAARSSVLILFSLVILGFIAALLWHAGRAAQDEHWTLRYGLASILGGALGNIYDRVAHQGSVTDFLDFYWGRMHFPVFNIADSAITIGAGLLLINMWSPKKRIPTDLPA